MTRRKRPGAVAGKSIKTTKQGHTKNSSHDGKAIPRHPDEYIELAFEILSGDLMIGLLGELPYE